MSNPLQAVKSPAAPNVGGKADVLRLDGEHRYWLKLDDGKERRLAGVSEVIQSALDPWREGWRQGMTDAAELAVKGFDLIYAARDERPKLPVNDWYLTRGSAVHLAIKLALEQRLDWSTVDPQIIGRVEAALKFIEDEKLEVCGVELMLASERLQYAGTLDLHGLLHKRFFILCDFKNSVAPQIIAQLGAYKMLCEENHRAVDRALGLELKEDGTYKCLWLGSAQLRKGENLFKSMLSLYNWKREVGLLRYAPHP